MNLPGGDDLIIKACELVFGKFEAAEAVETPGYRPRLFSELSVHEKAWWIESLRPVVELSIVALLTDQCHAVTMYDGTLGMAHQAAIIRYSNTELGYQPLSE